MPRDGLRRLSFGGNIIIPIRQIRSKSKGIVSAAPDRSGTRRALGPRGDEAEWSTLAGPSLADALRPSLGCPLGIRLRILFDVVLAVDLVHENQGAAQDFRCLGHLSPADIVVGANGVASVQQGTHDYRRDKLPAQPRRGYFAPELLLRKYPASRKTDVFSLGVMLWETLTQQRLFPQDNAQALFERIRSHELPEPGSLPAEAWALLMIAEKAFTYHPKNRYGTAGQLLKDMHQSAGNLVATHANVSSWVKETWKIETEYFDATPSLGREQTITEVNSDCLGEVHAQPIQFPRPPALPSLTELVRSSAPLALADESVETPRIPTMTDEARNLTTKPAPPILREVIGDEDNEDSGDKNRASVVPTVVPPAFAQAKLQHQSAVRKELSTIHEVRLTPVHGARNRPADEAETLAPPARNQERYTKVSAASSPPDSGSEVARVALHDLTPAAGLDQVALEPRQGTPRRGDFRLALIAAMTTLGLGWALLALL